MKVADIKRAACVDGGVTGSNWAIQFAMRRLAVTPYDINGEQLKRSKAQIYKSLDALEQLNAITPERRGEIVAVIRLITSMEEAAAGAQFIQESSPEHLGIKQFILAQVEACAVTDALYASSTSSLPVFNIATKAVHPECCVGAYPYNPLHLILLVELIFGDKTGPALLRLAYDFYQSIDKGAVLLRRGCSGFTADRLQLVLYREMQDPVMWGMCSVEGADKALIYDPGLRRATSGHSMAMQLGNPDGLTGMVDMLGNSGDRWLTDMASRTHQSGGWAGVVQLGVDEEMEHFPDHIGHTNKACAVHRDQMLIGSLKPYKEL